MRIFAASLVSAIILFFYGFLWWGVLMPMVRPANVISDPGLIGTMSSSLTESGPFFYPDYADQSGDQSGPMAILYSERDMPSMPVMMGMGFGHMWFMAFLVTLFVSRLPLPSFVGRFVVVFCSLPGSRSAIWPKVPETRHVESIAQPVAAQPFVA